MTMKVSLLSQEEKERIHARALDVLEKVGIQFNSHQALEILAQAGCQVDREELSARIPPALVEKALSTIPHQVTLAARDPKWDLHYGVGGPYFISSAQSAHFRDLETRKRRAPTSQDLIQCALICDALEEVDEFCPMVVPSDIPPPLRSLRASEIAYTHNRKHVLGWVDSLDALPFHLEVMDAVLGDRKKLRERPVFSHIINDISPLQKSGNLVDVTLALREFRIPIVLYHMPLSGATAPVTLAGTLLEMTANMLSSVVLYQLVEPGWPILWGTGAGPLDMRMGRVGGGPEAILMSVAHVELAHYYGLPSIGGGVFSYDAKQIGFQAGIEAVMMSLPVALAGTDALYGPADLDGANLVDLPYLIVCSELVRQLRRILRGIDLDEEHFLFDVMARLRFQGDYLGDPSTKRLFRQEHLLPRLFPRESYEAWEARGQTEEARAIAQVKEILRSHTPMPLPTGVARQLDRVLAAAQRALVH